MTGERRPNARGDVSGRKALDAAVKLTETHGWRNVTIEGIAQHAGIGKPTIYRRWPSKGMLLLEAFIEHFEQVFGDYLAQNPPTGDFVEDLRRVLKAIWVDKMRSYYRIFQALIIEAQQDPEVASGFRERLIAPTAAQLADQVRLAQSDGQVAPDIDPDQAVGLVFGQLYYHWLLIGTDPREDAFMDRIVDLAMKGLAQRKTAG